jgi:hypothetical protein
MSTYRERELSRFDPDKADRPGDDMRAGEAIWPAPTCDICGVIGVEYSGNLCDECAKEDEE